MMVANSVHTGAADRRPRDGTIRDRRIVAICWTFSGYQMHQRSGPETLGVSGRG